MAITANPLAADFTGQPTCPWSIPLVHHLWDLATSSDAVRDSYLAQALQFPATAEQFSRHIDMAMQAVAGLNPDRRIKVLSNVVLPYVST